MPRKTGPKCIASTRKPPNSKRSVEEIGQCTRFAVENSRFCEKHQNLHLLSDEDFKNKTRYCRGCKKHQYFSGDYKLCAECLGRGSENRERKKVEKVTYVPCIICGFTGGNERAYPNYCNKHATDGKKNDIERRGMKWCKGIIRGCPSPELPIDFPYENCEACRYKENTQDQKRSESKLVEARRYVANVPKIQIKPELGETQQTLPKKIQIRLKSKTDEVKCEAPAKESEAPISHIREPIDDFDQIYMIDGVFHKICSSPKHHQPHPLEEFFTEKGSSYYIQRTNAGDDLTDIIDYMKKHFMITRQCRIIREWQKIQEHKRTCTDQDPLLSEKRIEVKEYMELDAEAIRVYRKMHPEKCVRTYRGAIKSSDRRVSECQRSAKKRDISYELTSDQTKQLITDKCFYCGSQPIDCKFNGIDRLDHNESYVFENCVTSCSICNYMKACHDPLVFINLCEHILTYLQKITGTLHPELFMNFNMGKSADFLYDEYRRSANKRKYEWSLSTDNVEYITNQPCYLCGKLTTNEHTNGIDRHDNTIGYIISNCRPCCGNCNYLKRDNEYDVFINKLMQIHTNREAILAKLDCKI